jgi:hypothetical protein
MKTTFLLPLLQMAVLLLLALGGLRWVTGLFGRRTRVFEITAARQLRLAFWPLLALGAGLSVVPAVALSDRTNAYEWALAAGFLLFTLALCGPALVLHVRYSIINGGTAVVFQPDQNQLEVYEGGQRVPFERRDLVRVERVTCRARRSFQARYNFLRLHLAGGRVVVLTSLLMDLEPLAGFLRSVPVEQRAVRWCWL